MPDQKVYELEPLRGNTFAVKTENGLTLDFKRDAAGKVTEFSISQAGSSSIFRKAP